MQNNQLHDQVADAQLRQKLKKLYSSKDFPKARIRSTSNSLYFSNTNLYRMLHSLTLFLNTKFNVISINNGCTIINIQFHSERNDDNIDVRKCMIENRNIIDLAYEFNISEIKFKGFKTNIFNRDEKLKNVISFK